MPFDYVLNDMSYQNFLLYGRVIPSFDNNDGEGNKNEKVIDATDPANKEKVYDLFKHMK